MQDLDRFDRVYDKIGDHMDTEFAEDTRTDIDIIQERFLDLRGFVYQCLTRGWTDNDLLYIRRWITDQGEPTTGDRAIIATIDALVAPAPLPTAPPLTEDEALRRLNTPRTMTWTAEIPAPAFNITGIGAEGPRRG